MRVYRSLRLPCEQSRRFTVIHQNKRAGGEMRGLFSCCAAAFGGNMRFLLRRRLSRTDRCQSDGKSKKEQCGWGMSLRCSHDCLRGVDYLLYLFGRAFIAFTRSPPPRSSGSLLALFRSTAKARRAYERTGSQITIDPYAWRLREARPPFERDSFSHSRTRGTRINACSGHRKYLSDTRCLVIPTKVDGWF